MIPRIEWPMIFPGDNATYKFSFVENGRARELVMSKRDLGILLRSIGGVMERENRPVELVEHDLRCAV
jgi:hypothetical protein